MKKKLSTLFIYCAFITGGFSQSVNYSIIDNNTDALPKLTIKLSPLYFNMSKLSKGEVGFGLSANYELNDKMGFSFDFHRAYSGGMNLTYYTSVESYPVLNVDENKFKIPKYIDLGYRHVLIDKVVSKQVKVNLSTETVGNKEITNYFKASVNKRKRIIGRTGMFHFNGIVNNYEHWDDEPFIISDSLTLNGEFGVPFSVYSIYAGISTQTMTSASFNVDQYGNKRVGNINEFYADVVFAPVVSIQDIIYLDNTYDVKGKGEGQVAKNLLGFRLGWMYQFYNPDKKVNWGWKVETGSRPGVKDLGLYMDAHMYMTLNWVK